MTANQINAANVRENIRHNKAQEAISEYGNKIQSKHLQRQDSYTKEHYEQSDTAGLISANASAINAGTNRKKYEMDYDIEYGWSGDKGYPKGMPLSAQKKNAEIELLVLDPNDPNPNVQLTLEQRQADVQKTKAQALNAAASTAGTLLNSVFGKGGVVAAVQDIIS